MKRLLAKAAVCALLLVVPACGIPSLRSPQPGRELPPGFHEANKSGPDQPAEADAATSLENSSQLTIEDFFNDPILTGLIYQALIGNQELRILNEEVQIARNEIWGRSGAYLPFMMGGFSGGLEKPSLYTPMGAAEKELTYPGGGHFPDPLPNMQLGLNFFWQLDVWRQLRNARDAAAQRYLAAIQRRNYFVIRLVAEIADTYFELMSLDKRLDNLDRIIKLQEQSLELAKAKKAAGRGNELAVQRFIAEVRKNQSQKLIVNQDIIIAENRINFRLGRYPQQVERATGDFLALNLPAMKLGVPSQLLENRPDIRQAEREIAAAGLDVRVARARFFPVVTITGGVGYQAFNPAYLFITPEALVANVAGNIIGPLINKRAIQAEYRTANARQLQSVYNYQRVVLEAFTEVINRVTRVENFSRSIDIKKQQLKSLEASVAAASDLFQAVKVEYMDVLFAQRDLMDARMVLLETKQQQLSAMVNLYQALGGGLVPIFTSDPEMDAFMAKLKLPQECDTH